MSTLSNELFCFLAVVALSVWVSSGSQAEYITVTLRVTRQQLTLIQHLRNNRKTNKKRYFCQVFLLFCVSSLSELRCSSPPYTFISLFSLQVQLTAKTICVRPNQLILVQFCLVDLGIVGSLWSWLLKMFLFVFLDLLRLIVCLFPWGRCRM